MNSVLFVSDADNTLWDTDAVFAEAQLTLLSDVGKVLDEQPRSDRQLEFVREVDQQLAKMHHSGLKYPPELLARALALRLRGRDPISASKDALKSTSAGDSRLEEATASFIRALHVPPILRLGVIDGLRAVRALARRIIVFTESDVTKCEKLLSLYGLDKFVDQVFSGRKELPFFRRLYQLGEQDDVRVVIGDQLDRDIARAKGAGFVTILFPGGFSPHWLPKDVTPDYTVQSYADVAPIIQKLASSI